jgi:hypothetical protein
MRKYAFIFTTLILFGLALGACASGSAGDPADTVENYLQALVARDMNRMVSLSCADWESQVRLEHDSFAAVTLNLNEVACRQIGEEGDAALVTCTGSIIANYGAEDLEIDVADRVYRLSQEGGEWRMCGYMSQ